MPALPIGEWLPQYDRKTLRFDVIAGLTVWAHVVPQSIAYAQIAGLPPQAGIFCSFAAPLGYANFGTSRQLIVSPTSATAAISASLVAPLVLGDEERFRDLLVALAILCGVVFILLGRWKMGFVSQFIATAVQAGFLVGLGLTIIVGQSATPLGVSGEDGPFYNQFGHLIRHLNETSGWTAVVGVGALAAMIVCRRVAPGLPAALIFVVVAIVVVSILNLDGKGVVVVGDVDRAFPLPSIPTEINLSDLATLLPGTFAIVIIGYTESVSVAEKFAEEHKYEIRPNTELVALGTSSALSGLFQGFIAGGGASQSAANDRAGAKTQAAGIVLAGLALLTAVALMPLFRNLPSTVLAAIVISAVMGFVGLTELRRIHQLNRTSYIFAAIALVGVLILGILPGLLLTVALSILLLLSRLSRPHSAVLGRFPGTTAFVDREHNPEAVLDPHVLIFRLESPLIFINAAWMRDELRAAMLKADPPPQVVILNLGFSHDLDIKSIVILAGLKDDFDQKGIELRLANVHGPVRDCFNVAGSPPGLAKPMSPARSTAHWLGFARLPARRLLRHGSRYIVLLPIGGCLQRSNRSRLTSRFEAAPPFASPPTPRSTAFVCRRRLGDQRTRFDRRPAANARSGR